ncbi:MAG TPA: nuclear transport factor 2 family protein [Puia sp.]|nr:nuclear transport factor 2 family protein [Puia sp.]
MRKHLFLAGAGAIIFFACNDPKPRSADLKSPEMTQRQKDERNKAIILKCISAYAAKDSAYILDQSIDDVVNIYGGQPPIHGNDSARIVLRQAFNLIKDYKPGNQIALADHNYVFVFQYVEISNTKNDDKWHAKQVEIFKFNDDGKIILHTSVSEELGPNDVRVPF